MILAFTPEGCLFLRVGPVCGWAGNRSRLFCKGPAHERNHVLFGRQGSHLVRDLDGAGSPKHVSIRFGSLRMKDDLEDGRKESLSKLDKSDGLGVSDNGTDDDIPEDTDKLEAYSSADKKREREESISGRKTIREAAALENEKELEEELDKVLEDDMEINSDEINDLIGYDDVQRLNETEKIRAVNPVDGKNTKKRGYKGRNRAKETDLFGDDEEFENQFDEYLEDDLRVGSGEMRDAVGNEDVFGFGMDGRFDEEDAVDLNNNDIPGDLGAVTGASYDEHNDIIMTPTKEDMALGGLVDAKPRTRSRVTDNKDLLSDLENVDDVDDNELLEAAETLKSSGLLTSEGDESYSDAEEEELLSRTEEETEGDVHLTGNGGIHKKEGLVESRPSDDKTAFEDLTSQQMFLQKRKSASGYLWQLNDDCDITVTRKGEGFSLDETDDEDAEHLKYDFGGLGQGGGNKESMELFEPIRKRRTPRPRFGTSMGSSKHLVEGSKEWIARKSFELLQKPDPMVMHRWVKRRYDAPKEIRDLYPPLRDTLLPHSFCVVDKPKSSLELDDEAEASAKNKEIGQGLDDEDLDEEGLDEEGL